MANGNNNQTVGETSTALFSSSANGSGSDMRGALAISIYNGDSDETLLVQPDWYETSEWAPIPPGTALTFEVEDQELEILTVNAKRAGSVDVTGVGWGVTKKGKGSVAVS